MPPVFILVLALASPLLLIPLIALIYAW